MLCIFIAAILIPPAFPSQDGPVHLYYAQVMRDLIADRSAWDGYFVLRPGIPPYMLHNLLLFALAPIFPPLTAEKILAALSVALLCIAFRSMVKSLEPRASWTALLIFPVVMHKPLYMGFYNFSLGLGIALFLSAWWIRRSHEFGRRDAALFLLGIALLSITHPVALALTLSFAAIELAVGGIMRNGWRLTALSAGCLSVLYIALYTKLPPTQPVAGLPAMLSHAGSALEAIWPMRTPLHQIVRISVCAGAAGLLAFRTIKAGRPRAGAIAILIFSAACTVAFIIAPDNMNGADYFNERFAIFAFVFALALCASINGPRSVEIGAGLTAAVFALTLLVEQSIRTRPFAEEAARLDNAMIASPNQRGVVLATRGAIGPPDFNFSPCAHLAAHYFRRAHAILVNSVWLHMPIAAITPRAWEAGHFLDPHRMTDFGLRHPDRLPRVDFIAAESCPPGSTDAGLQNLIDFYGAEHAVMNTRCVAIFASSRVHSRLSHAIDSK
jgi:hypothetical protein